MPNITTNHAITYTNFLLGHNPFLAGQVSITSYFYKSPPHSSNKFLFYALIVHAPSKSMQLCIESFCFCSLHLSPVITNNVKLSSKQPDKMSSYPWIWPDKSHFWPDILWILIDLQNSSYPTQPHSIIANYLFRTVYPWWTLSYLLTYHACICFFYIFIFLIFLYFILSLICFL